MLKTVNQEIYYTMFQPRTAVNLMINVKKNWQQLAMEQINSLTPLKVNTGTLWAGNASAGYSYTRSSAVGRFNADVTLSYTTRKIEVVGMSSLITTTTDSTHEFENASATIYSSYLFTPRWRGIVLLNYQHNLELGLQQRFQEGLAGGFSLISSAHTQGKLLSGLVLSHSWWR